MIKEAEFIMSIIKDNETYIMQKKIDWDVLYDMLIRQRVFGYVYPKIIKFIPNEYKEKYEKYNVYRRSRIKAYLEATREINEFVNDNNYSSVFVKGAIYS